MQKEMLFWIWLSEALGAANKSFRPLIELYENPYDIFYAEEEELDRLDHLSLRVRERLADKSLEHATAILDTCERLGIGILPYGDPAYPKLLRAISTPPVLLYYKGKLPDFSEQLFVSMVGTRRMSAYGLQSAYKLSYELATAGAVVVSGMAAGIDGVCAAAALAAKGNTVAILGCGLDVVYPKHHKCLMDEICNKGLLISEYPPGTRPNHYHFPIRNRLISALSQATVVVEAGLRSGSLITAKEAILQGRDVFALPANVGSRGAEGTNGLLRDGVNLALDAEDILERYGYAFSGSLHIDRLAGIGTASHADLHFLDRLGVIELTASAQQGAVSAVSAAKPNEEPKPKRSSSRVKSEKKPSAEASSAEKTVREPVVQKKTPDEVLSSLSDIQRAVLEAIPDDRAITADTLGGLGYPYGDIIAAITMLEILGLVQKLPGALYTKT